MLHAVCYPQGRLHRNAGVRTSGRWSGPVLLTLAFCLVAAWPAQAGQTALQRTLQQADELYKADKLQQAADLYQRALRQADGVERRRCFEQLLSIYMRVGREDEAIQTGLAYGVWLQNTRDLARLRTLNVSIGHWYLDLGHYADAEKHLRASLAESDGASLPPARRIMALTYVALAAERAGDPKRAALAWREVETFARAQLDEPQKLDPLARIECIRKLADSYRFQKKHTEAVAWLEKSLPAFARLKDAAGPENVLEIRRDTLRELAGHLLAVKRHADAEKHLREALVLHQQHAAKDRLTQADLTRKLAEALEAQGQAGGAKALRQQAVRDYRAVVKDPQAGAPEVARALAAFWKLQRLYERANQYRLALQLTQHQAEEWGGGLLEAQLQAEEGRLHILLGEFSPSRKLLANAVRALEKQSPRDLTLLPVTLLNLGLADLATDNLESAKQAGNRCLALYSEGTLADDPVLVETHNLLGNCLAYDGDYAKALAHFREGQTICGRLGSTADPQRCWLLLHEARLYRLQGDLDRAQLSLQKALEVYERFAVADDLIAAAFEAFKAARLAVQVRLREANRLAGKVLTTCAKYGDRKDLLVLTALVRARHCQALFRLSQRDYAGATSAWEEIQRLHGPDSPWQPRTLNYLALTCECQNQWDAAANLYEQALKLQEKNARASPITHFNTLWRLAVLTDRSGRPDEARALLDQALRVIEQARLRMIFGDAKRHADFTAQALPAFERLVEWCVRDGKYAAAVVAATRGSSQTLLDRLRLADVDPLRSVPEPDRGRLQWQKADLEKLIAGLRARLQLQGANALNSDKTRALLTQLDDAQDKLAEVNREILNASEAYRKLVRQAFTTKDLDRLRDRVLGPKKLLLVYHVGREQSHLLLVGDTSRPLEAYPLMVPENVARRIAPPPPVALALALAKARGLVLNRERVQPELPAPPTSTRAVPLGEKVLRALVDNYLEQITDPAFRPTRGLRLQSRQPTQPLPAQRPELLADILLPRAVCARICALAPAGLIIVPDGALHKLPFEALLLRAGSEPLYALDSLPPLVYAPSVAIVDLLAKRQPAAPAGVQSLLTVADPAYPPIVKGGIQAAPRQGQDPPAGPVLDLPPLARLPHTAKESERIRGFFEPKAITPLPGPMATKKAVVDALPGQHVVHIAAHGFAYDLRGKAVLALALTPPGQITPEDDGLLKLHEIYMLKLNKCELAVLSACETNVGPQQQVEGGSTLALGFLAAGARRVVASHWSVDDESTAELMAQFFKEAKKRAESTGTKGLAAYARALQQARLQIRDRRDPAGNRPWAAPYFWAPFVLIGPAD